MVVWKQKVHRTWPMQYCSVNINHASASSDHKRASPSSRDSSSTPYNCVSGHEKNNKTLWILYVITSSKPDHMNLQIVPKDPESTSKGFQAAPQICPLRCFMRMLRAALWSKKSCEEHKTVPVPYDTSSFKLYLQDPSVFFFFFFEKRS